MSTCRFKVRAEVEPGLIVYVSGNNSKLGNWNVDHAIELQPLAGTDCSQTTTSLWECQIDMTYEDVEYCYFLANSVFDHDEHVAVSKFEIYTRTHTFSENNNSTADTFGESDLDGQAVRGVRKGWLTHQSEIQFRLHGSPLCLFGRKELVEKWNVSCSVLNISHPGTVADPNAVKISLYGIEPEAVPHAQPEGGVTFMSSNKGDKNGMYLVFRTQVCQMKMQGYVFRISTTGGEVVGTVTVLPGMLSECTGVICTPLVSLSAVVVGQMTVDYLVVKPLENLDVTKLLPTCKRSTSQQFFHSPITRDMLHVGHRGMGSSFNKAIGATVTENTVASLSEAAENGADFVEFDVQLTKDKIPIVYHDLKTCVAAQKKNGGRQKIPLPISHLTLNDLRELHTYAVVGITDPPGDPSPSISVEERTFPTLLELVKEIKPKVGLNLEVKYCLKRKKAGEYEEDMDFIMSRNQYLDIILEALLPLDLDVPIIFSCFDPDICIMLQLKQNKYPVAFLTQGDSKKYDPYLDHRCCTSDAAIHFVYAESLLAVNFHTEELLDCPALLETAKELCLHTWCWGTDNNCEKNRSWLNKFGIDSVIYDKIYESRPNMSNIFKEKSSLGIQREDGLPPPSKSPRIE